MTFEDGLPRGPVAGQPDGVRRRLPALVDGTGGGARHTRAGLAPARRAEVGRARGSPLAGGRELCRTNASQRPESGEDYDVYDLIRRKRPSFISDRLLDLRHPVIAAVHRPAPFAGMLERRPRWAWRAAPSSPGRVTKAVQAAIREDGAWA
jgi:hypothetical protein